MKLSEQYQFISIFEIILVSYIGFITPLTLDRDEHELGNQNSLIQWFFAPQPSCDLTRRQTHGQLIQSNRFLNSPSYKILKSFSAGVILGVAVLHLLDDAIEKLRPFSNKPVAEIFVCVGITVTLCLEQIAIIFSDFKSENGGVRECSEELLKQRASSGEFDSRGRMLGELAMSYGAGYGSCQSSDDPSSDSHDLCTSQSDLSSSSGPLHLDLDHCHEHHHGQEIELMNYDQTQSSYSESSNSLIVSRQKKSKDYSNALARTVVLEVSVSVHSMIIGFGLGSTSDVAVIRLLMIALAFHQFFEGISLGSMILETNLPAHIRQIFAIVFALSLPTGCICGMIAAGEGSVDGDAFVSGCANSIAAGSLIYTCLVEIIHEDFRHCFIVSGDSQPHSHAHSSHGHSHAQTDMKPHEQRELAVYMIAALFSGCGIMAILAIFA